MMVKDILLIDSSYPINTRNKRLILTLQKYFNDVSVEYITWNRDCREVDDADKNMSIYNVRSAYGNLFNKLIHLGGYYRFLRKYNELKRPKIIVASHWDMLFLASLMKQKGQYLIYEDLDIPTIGNRYLLKLLQWLENIALKKTDAIVFASRFFKPLYASFMGKTFVLENKPIQNPLRVSHVEDDSNFTIAYIGLVRYADVLKNLIDAVRDNKNISLRFHGEGQDLDLLKKYAAGSTNIFFTGRYEISSLPRLYSTTDLVWAAYPNKDYNVKYAISNKFHESIAYQVPCIYAEKTCLGELVLEKNLGYIVDPYDKDAIKSCILQVLNNRKDLETKKQSLILYGREEKGWDEQFLPIMDYVKSL